MKISRRSFLRASGAVVALPFLEAMSPEETPRRLVAVCTNLGMMPRFFFPEKAGRDYPRTPYLALLEGLRPDLTVFSGLSHPQVDGGHETDICFLTGAPHPGRGGFRNSISLDRFAAERIGVRTRLPSLALKIGPDDRAGLSWTGAGVLVPPERRPSVVYRRLFVQGTAAEVEAQLRRLREGRSILDAVAERASALMKRLGAGDRDRMNQYFTSVRELEGRLEKAGEWERRPKPRVDAPPPADARDLGDLIGNSGAMFELTKLALQTDSTRLVTLLIHQANTGPAPKVEGVRSSHHSLTHHGNRPESVEELRKLESAQVKVFGGFLEDLKAIREEGRPLLDRTMVLYGSNLGNANSHDTSNLPILLAGGGFRHGQHLAFDPKSNAPLANLFVTLLQRLGLEVDRFASSTGSLAGLGT